MSNLIPEVLEVQLYEQTIGRLTHLPGDRTYFGFDEQYLNNPARPVLGQQFINVQNELISETKSTVVRAPAFFSNLLPEGVLRHYLAKLAQVNPARDFPLLAILGQDLPGAITIRAQTNFSSQQQKQDIDGVDESLLYRFSLAGVQLKFSAMVNQQGGLTIPAQGIGGDWIIKLPSVHFQQVPENEYSMLLWAKKIGIESPEISLTAVAKIDNLPKIAEAYQNQQALLVRRFDRQANSKIHIEDFAQVYNLYPEQKYEKVSYDNIAGTLFKIAGEAVALDFIRRLIFTMLIGNCDMHLKNWSLIYPDKVTPKLSPAYDFVSTLAYIPEDGLALSFGGEKQFSKLGSRQIDKFIRKAQLPKQLVLKEIEQTVVLTQQVWPEIKALGLLSGAYQVELEKHLRRMARQLLSG